SGAEKLPNWPSPVTGAPDACTSAAVKVVKLTQTLFAPTAIAGWSALTGIDATFVNDLPPSVETATGTSAKGAARYTIQRFPNRAHAICWAQQISPSGAPGPGRLDVVTTFDGSVGLRAMASSASFPGIALESKFVGRTAAPASVAVARATTTVVVVTKNRPRIVLSPFGSTARLMLLG